MSDLCPTCFSEIGIWLDDPILTPKGLSGNEYKGNTEANVEHIRELQARCIEEEEINSVSPRTTFSVIGKNGKREFTLQHINEIRHSIEKILFAKVGGGTDLTPLFEQYFNYDAEGNSMGTSKTNWTDIELDNETKIKAIHIEDLRHPIPEIIDLEYPGTGFLRRYATLNLTNVHTIFHSPEGGSLDNGDEIRFTSEFAVENTDDFETNFWAQYHFGYPGHWIPSNWNLSGSISNIIAQITAKENEYVTVNASLQTDGKYLYHYYEWDETSGKNVEVWILSESYELTIEVFDEALGEVIEQTVYPIDDEKAEASWTSNFIGRANKSPVYQGVIFRGWNTSFGIYSGGYLNRNPAPRGYIVGQYGYVCKRIGRGTPEEYWQAWNLERGYSEGDPQYTTEDYIGDERITVDLGLAYESVRYYRTYSNSVYGEFYTSASSINAVFEKEGSPTLTYTCNVI